MARLRMMRDRIGSPYLAQHVDNPVDWWSWGRDAFEEARRLDRPVFLSIGYASCHWCHVMAHECFEDPAIAQQLNDSFIAIKVDREERPDIDAIYMAATQLVSGHGGWPMSVFLLPDGRPFMAGTYYPPQDRRGQIGFPRLLSALSSAWASQREEVVNQAQELQTALEREVSFIDHLGSRESALDVVLARRRLRDDLVLRLDPEGGFGPAPKFPRASFVTALLEFNDENARRAVELTLDAMARRGLYDHLEGGFARYSVDASWHVPHFEKMLSDQALLARAYLAASRANPLRTDWREAALATLRFVVRDLAVAKGFASSLDADANGVEGSHVTWTLDEVSAALTASGLAEQTVPVAHRLSIGATGNFEGRCIPRLADDEPFLTPDELTAAFEALREARRARVQPSRDGKVILEWNAMFASACLASGDDDLRARALGLLGSLHQSHFKNGQWWRVDADQVHATANDVAWMLNASLDAFEATGDDRWLRAARDLAASLLAHYWDGEIPTASSPNVGGGVFTSSDLVSDLTARPKEILDGATPSGHSIACRSLARLALCDGDVDLLCSAQRLLELAGSLVTDQPTSVPDLVEAAGFAYGGIAIVIPGESNELSEHVRSKAMNRTVLITGSGSSPLLEGRVAGLAYVCLGGSCQLPVATANDLDAQLRELLA